ncbi:hypothetical protein B9Q02_11345 [Candidatus Marsarchaeota G1 archaeon BE_D]|jgi:CRISPR-associated protein Cas5, Hmari subtype|uniref:Type I-B CRISPR-associated protein Cas5 n=1 Tax=Candidatus Marsarchaeota G1 archaeon BE_D TaxID=1978156 RepID=A0A2R6A8P5_9ARCH|nr:MAG: hypothetical protein B9Q02_11345 [Candidatus Marsarchaeota G1 archaeon BE_D]
MMCAFDIKGYLAHFRKVYSTTSSLSYVFPPRTTVMGLLAAIVGKNRDSYYEEYSQLKIAISIKSKIRKLVFSSNYLDTDSISHSNLRGIKGRVPVTREILVENNGGIICYRIFVAGEVGEIVEAFKRGPCYPVALGVANFLGWIERFNAINGFSIFNSCEQLNISTVVPNLKSITIKPEPSKRIILEERVPRTFDSYRRSGELMNYLYEESCGTLQVSGKAEFFKCKDLEGELNGIFM